MRLQLAEIHPRLEQQIQNTRQRAGLVGQREQYRSLVGCGSVRGLGADDHKTRLIRRLILKVIATMGKPSIVAAGSMAALPGLETARRAAAAVESQAIREASGRC